MGLPFAALLKTTAIFAEQLKTILR